MKIAREQFIRLFDEKSKDEGHDGSDVTATIGLLGEDLLLGVLQHYWKTHEGIESRVLSYKCTSGKQKGSRLDGWLLKESDEKHELYQVELKNWAVYAIGGKELKLDATEQDLQTYSQKRWTHHFAPEEIPDKNLRKVVMPMKNPLGYGDFIPIPLVCFWFYIAESVKSPYRRRRYANGKEVHIFSASAYLRGLKDDYIDIAMPRVKRRMGLLSKLILSE